MVAVVTDAVAAAEAAIVFTAVVAILLIVPILLAVAVVAVVCAIILVVVWFLFAVVFAIVVFSVLAKLDFEKRLVAFAGLDLLSFYSLCGTQLVHCTHFSLMEDCHM